MLTGRDRKKQRAYAMRPSYLEFIVGVFLAVGMLCLAYLSIKVARHEFFNTDGYAVRAVFSNCSGLKPGSSVMIAGVEIGRVKKIALQDYDAQVQMVIQQGVVLQKDAIASIRTKGLIGEKYIDITPGGDPEKIQPGGLIHDTEPAMDMEGLISKYVHGSLATPTNGTAPTK
jgi:phospholipid/cholesterol/gamma-HCH transport system substrate-binding protein